MARLKFSYHFVCLALLLLGCTERSFAGIILVTDAASLGAQGTINWANALSSNIVPQPFVASVSGIPGLSAQVSDPAVPYSLQRLVQSASGFYGWAGNFLPGTTLLNTNGDPGPIAIQFSTPVQGVGTQLESSNCQIGCWNGTFNINITAFDSLGALLGSFWVSGTSSSAADGSAEFVGVLSDSANIKSVEFNVDVNSDFSINQVDVTDTPEPGTAALLLFPAVMILCGWTAKRLRRSR
jgi:hypothetical protein